MSESIDEKKKKSNKETDSVVIKEVMQFIGIVVLQILFMLFLFTISAGAIVNAKTSNAGSNWVGTNINGLPYKQSDSKTPNLFDFPYIFDTVREMSKGNHVSPFVKAQLWPWAIRMTAFSYSSMRLLFQKNLTMRKSQQ